MTKLRRLCAVLALALIAPRVARADSLSVPVYQGEFRAPRILLAQAPANNPPPPNIPTVPAIPPSVAAYLGAISWNLGDNFSMGVSTQLVFHATIDRDYVSGNWDLGYGMEVLPIYRQFAGKSSKTELAYVGIYNVFNTADKKGVFGADIGVHVVTVFSHAAVGLVNGLTSADVAVPAFLDNIGMFVTAEVGFGYRFLGNPGASDGVKNYAGTLGGQISYPLANFWNKYGSL